MPESMDLLKRVAEDVPHLTPWPAVEVRRLGNRRRHRRTAALAAACVLVAVGAVAGVSRLGSEADTVSPAGPTRIESPTVPGVLAHSGLGRLRLGMSVDQARATGEIRTLKRSPGAPGCTGFVLRGVPRPAGDGVDGYISPSNRVEAIFARSTMRTPEGIGIGSTSAQVDAAYSSIERGANGWFVRLVQPAGTPTTGYSLIISGGKVSELSVQRANVSCFG